MIDGREFVGILLFHVCDEFLLRVEVHLGITLFLLLQGRVFAAIVVVPGVDEQFVGEGAVSVIQRMILAYRVAVGEVGASAGSYEQGVGGEDAVGQYDGDEVLGVPRGVDELDGEVPDPKAVAVLDPHIYAAGRGALVHHDLRRRLGLELPGSGDVISVGVGVHYVGRLEAVLEDVVEHRLDHLQLGVDDRGRTGISDYVAEASAIDAELLEKIDLLTLFYGRSSFPAPLPHPLEHLARMPHDAIVEHLSTSASQLVSTAVYILASGRMCASQRAGPARDPSLPLQARVRLVAVTQG